MSWRDEWRAGSFRSVPFKWKQSDATVGRKTARHDYPKRDDAYVEDMGLRPREFTLECFVIGQDYIDQRDALVSALETAGPGTLEHPTMGTMFVSLNGDVRMSESTSEGGMCRFTIPLIRVEEDNYPSEETDTAAQVEDSSDDLIDASESDFEDEFSCEDEPDNVTDDAESLTDQICGVMDGLAAKFKTSTATPGFVKDLNKIQNSIKTLIGKPFTLAKSISGQINKLRDLALAPLNLILSSRTQLRRGASLSKSIQNLPTDLFNAYAGLFDYGRQGSKLYPSSAPSTSESTTPSKARKAKNQAALTALVRRTAIAEAARTSAEMDHASYDDAMEMRDRIADAIDAELLDSSDSVYSALVDLRAAVVTDINARGANLSRIVTITLSRTEPALVIAHRLYRDATRAEELITRNNIAHPSFVPGGEDLEVLSD
ncbi:MAG: DNA circularization N-terminal domain-containing protein [Spirochaetaceae bacterium]|nr:DNA circularization N-terminal domain-containing protein [Spirochaetaceae bacterium]